MAFTIKTTINIIPSLKQFISDYALGKDDLIVSNEYILLPHLKDVQLECHVIYQEKFGQGEPTDEMVDAMLQEINGKGYKRIIAIGGGTVMDICKLFVFGDGLTCQEIYSQGAQLPKQRTLIAIPTTCGTGSEVTSIAITQFKAKNTKLGLAVPALFPDEAVLIRSLFKTLPYEIFAISSVDALIHAIESYVSPKADVFTKMYSQWAIEKILEGYKKIAISNKDAVNDLIEDFMIASCFAGIAFSNAGVGAVHALSYPLGVNFNIPHGQANYLVFIEVFNKYREKEANILSLEKILAQVLDVWPKGVWEELAKLLDHILPRKPLRDYGMTEEQIKEFTQSTIENQQRLLANNPVDLSFKDLEDIYQKVY